MPEAISRVMAACLRKEMSRRRFRSWLTPDLEREELEFALLAELALLVELDLLDDLETRHREAEHTRGAIFDLRREIVLEGGIDTKQGREGLVDTHGGDIVHRRGREATRHLILDKAQSVHVFLPSTVRGIATHTIHALVGMAQGETL